MDERIIVSFRPTLQSRYGGFHLTGEMKSTLNTAPLPQQTHYRLNIWPESIKKQEGVTEQINTKLETRAPLCLFNFSSAGNRFGDGSRPRADKF